MPDSSLKKNGEKEKLANIKLLELHGWIIGLEKLEILRQKSLLSPADMEKSCRDLLRQSRKPICIIQDRKIIYLSPSLAKLLGSTEQEMLNSPFANYVHPNELFRLVEYYLQRMSGREAPSVYSSILRRRDGKDLRVEIMAGIFPYHEKPADFVIVKKLPD